MWGYPWLCAQQTPLPSALCPGDWLQVRGGSAASPPCSTFSPQWSLHPYGRSGSQAWHTSPGPSAPLTFLRPGQPAATCLTPGGHSGCWASTRQIGSRPQNRTGRQTGQALPEQRDGQAGASGQPRAGAVWSPGISSSVSSHQTQQRQRGRTAGLSRDPAPSCRAWSTLWPGHARPQHRRSTNPLRRVARELVRPVHVCCTAHGVQYCPEP